MIKKEAGKGEHEESKDGTHEIKDRDGILDYVRILFEEEDYQLRDKRIFLLTDGEVNDPKSVIGLAKIYCDEARIHTFGIGSGCSKDLVLEVARAGRGTYSFVEETDNLKAKVINALKKATEPSLKNARFYLG